MVDPASPFTSQPPAAVAGPGAPPSGALEDSGSRAPGTSRAADARIEVSQLLRTQLHLVNTLQKQLVGGGLNSLTPREIKDHLASISSMLALADRTGEMQRELDTYKLLLDTIFAWIRQRADSTGEDLLAELRQVGAELRNSEGVSADKFF